MAVSFGSLGFALTTLRFPILFTGVRRLVAMTGAYQCPRCDAKTAKA